MKIRSHIGTSRPGLQSKRFQKFFKRIFLGVESQGFLGIVWHLIEILGSNSEKIGIRIRDLGFGIGQKNDSKEF